MNDRPCHGNRKSIRVDPEGFHWYNWEFSIYGPRGGKTTFQMHPIEKFRWCEQCGAVLSGEFRLGSHNATTRKLFPCKEHIFQTVSEGTPWESTYCRVCGLKVRRFGG